MQKLSFPLKRHLSIIRSQLGHTTVFTLLLKQLVSLSLDGRTLYGPLFYIIGHENIIGNENIIDNKNIIGKKNVSPMGQIQHENVINIKIQIWAP